MGRRAAMMTAAGLVAAMWLVGQPRTAQAGNGWIFRPSYQDYTPKVDANKARQMAFRQRLQYGGQSTGYAIYGYRHTYTRLSSSGSGGSGHPYSGSTRYHIREYFFSVPSPD